MKKDLGNFGILITGGGTGIGKACAAEMYSHGAFVTICGRTEEKLKQSVHEIVESPMRVATLERERAATVEVRGSRFKVQPPNTPKLIKSK